MGKQPFSHLTKTSLAEHWALPLGSVFDLQWTAFHVLWYSTWDWSAALGLQLAQLPSLTYKIRKSFRKKPTMVLLKVKQIWTLILRLSRQCYLPRWLDTGSSHSDVEPFCMFWSRAVILHCKTAGVIKIVGACISPIPFEMGNILLGA